MFEIQFSYVLSKIAVQTKFLLIIQSPTITTAVKHLIITVTVRVIYQLVAIFVYFSSICFGLTRPSSGAVEFIISFTNAAYGVL